jgi:hypothetical protein
MKAIQLWMGPNFDSYVIGIQVSKTLALGIADNQGCAVQGNHENYKGYEG